MALNQAKYYSRGCDIFLFKNDFTPDSDNRTDEKTEISEKEEKIVTCAHCGFPISRKKYIVPINGNSEHTYFNPSGHMFNFICFSEAKGCYPYGSPTSEFSWFEGYLWHYALCASCGYHLGWHFINESTSFYGLITTEISLP